MTIFIMILPPIQQNHYSRSGVIRITVDVQGPNSVSASDLTQGYEYRDIQHILFHDLTLNNV